MSKLKVTFVILLFLLSMSKATFGYEVDKKEGQEDCAVPVIAPQGKLFICGSNTIQLSVLKDYVAYKWFKDNTEIIGATAASLEVLEPGQYKVIATDHNGCETSSSETAVFSLSDGDTLPFENMVAENGEKTALGFRFCQGEKLQLEVLGNFNLFVWNIEGVDTSSPTIEIDKPGTYEVAARIEGGCVLSRTITVTTYTPPSIQVEASDSIFRPGQSINLFASGADEFRWYPVEGLSNPEIANPTASPTQSTTYYVTGIGVNGCRDTTEVTLHLDADKINVLPPKVFSPNNDGIDDVWYIENMDAYPNCELIIFNRSGLQVFKAKPYLNNWDGFFNGKPLSEGDYYFVMRCGGDQNLKTGSIMLIR